MQQKIEWEVDEERIRPTNSEVERLWASNSKAKAILGWEPKYGGLDGFKKGLQKTIDWFIKKENLSKYKINIYNI
jgi:dTDP-glucose 4,6-dehydratase